MVLLDTKPGTWAPEEYPPRLIFFDEYRLDQISHSEKAYDKVNKTKCDTCVPIPEEKNTLASLFFLKLYISNKWAPLYRYKKISHWKQFWR